MIIILAISIKICIKDIFDIYVDMLSTYEESKDDAVCAIPGRALDIAPDTKEMNAASNDVFIIR